MKIGKQIIDKLIAKINFDAILAKANINTSKEEIVEYVIAHVGEQIIDIFNRVKLGIIIRAFIVSTIIGLLFGLFLGIFIN